MTEVGIAGLRGSMSEARVTLDAASAGIEIVLDANTLQLTQLRTLTWLVGQASETLQALHLELEMETVKAKADAAANDPT